VDGGWAGVERRGTGGGPGVSILAQKCEWVTHTLRGPDTPPGGPSGGSKRGPGGSCVQWGSGQPVMPRGLTLCVPASVTGTQGLDGGQQGVGLAWGWWDPRLPDGVWGECRRIVPTTQTAPKRHTPTNPIFPTNKRDYEELQQAATDGSSWRQ